MGHGYFTIVGYGLIITKADIISYLEEDIDYKLSKDKLNKLVELVVRSLKIDEKLFFMHKEEQHVGECNTIFITHRRSKLSDARGACGWYNVINTDELKLTETEILSLKKINLGTLFTNDLIAYSYEGS